MRLLAYNWRHTCFNTPLLDVGVLSLGGNPAPIRTAVPATVSNKCSDFCLSKYTHSVTLLEYHHRRKGLKRVVCIVKVVLAPAGPS